MTMVKAPSAADVTAEEEPYRLNRQIGFVMRRAQQRHIAIFGAQIKDLTPTQFAALAKLFELGAVSQNDLGRQTAMDAATMKGVIDRLARRGLVETRADPSDMRRILIELTEAGRAAFLANEAAAVAITEATLAPLSESERATLLPLLERLTGK